ncbi:SVM family protein, predicted signal peptide, putative phyllody effector [Candidatus Phytoplasma rubi]|uniref:SVM family protein, predicted signal peptide, putative phyllody effector n=1 Tax=Candidatus Phytoplasma rubi TaxID=399025 RepID=A0ABY7BTX6_9MOLU|nr:SVM family protein, predicted signal peptide, putative phyllody effector [Candidatus Phytoplasma rubi]
MILMNIFIFLGFFLIINNNQIMGMNEDIPSTSDNNQNINNSSIEQNIINLKHKIYQNAVQKRNIEKEIQQLSNNNSINNDLLALKIELKQKIENLINNNKEQLKTYQILLKTLNDENN